MNFQPFYFEQKPAKAINVVEIDSDSSVGSIAKKTTKPPAKKVSQQMCIALRLYRPYNLKRLFSHNADWLHWLIYSQ